MDSNIHQPTDSSLLVDCVRVLVRYLYRAQAVVDVPFTNHNRRAKRRMLNIQHTRKKAQRVRAYRDLIKITEKTVNRAKQALTALETTYSPEALEVPELETLHTKLSETVGLTERVLNQTRRRVIDGESVPAGEKIVSIFEPHTDIIIKDRRDTLYGHKLCLTAGASGLVTDCVVEKGNPSDKVLAVSMIQRHIDVYGEPPRQASFDGGFYSIANLKSIKSLGVDDVAFSKARGIDISEMVKSSWVYRRLRHFRAGIEGIISFLKRCFGWDRCNWRTLASFKSYAWSSVVTANLLVLARHALL
jgi:IS5 family transposase